jgi:hypothetical protein
MNLAASLANWSPTGGTERDQGQIRDVRDKPTAQNAELPCFTLRGQSRFRRQVLDAAVAAQVAEPEEGAPKRKSAPNKEGCR